MQKKLKFILIILIQLIAGSLFYYIFIKHLLKINFNDAVGLIIVGAISFIIGVIYYLKMRKKLIFDLENFFNK